MVPPRPCSRRLHLPPSPSVARLSSKGPRHRPARPPSYLSPLPPFSIQTKGRLEREKARMANKRKGEGGGQRLVGGGRIYEPFVNPTPGTNQASLPTVPLKKKNRSLRAPPVAVRKRRRHVLFHSPGHRFGAGARSARLSAWLTLLVRLFLESSLSRQSINQALRFSSFLARRFSLKAFSSALEMRLLARSALRLRPSWALAAASTSK